MPYYRRTNYRHRRSRSSTTYWVWAIGTLVVLILVTRALADRGRTANTNTTNAAAADLSLLNIGNVSDANSNTNANANTDTGASDTGNGAFAKNFLADYCTKPISEYGSKKLAVLTFDAGAGTGSAAQILDILKSKNAPAGVFMTGKWAEQNTETAKKFADAGVGIYNHTYDHPHLPTLTRAEVQDEITRANTAITAATGVDTTKPVLRPPYGELSESVTATVRAAGYCPLLWTVDALDWQEGQTADAAKARVLARLKPGTIVLMHVGDDLVPQFLGDLIDAIRAQGYALVGLPGLFAANPVPVKPTNSNVNTSAGTNTNKSTNANTTNANRTTNANTNTTVSRNTNTANANTQ